MIKDFTVARGWSLIVIFMFLLVFSGCPTIHPPQPPEPMARTGAMLVRHGGYLYLIGGVNELGEFLDTVYYASIPGDDEDPVWVATVPLSTKSRGVVSSHPRAFGAAFAAGNMIYVVGGHDGTKPMDSVLYIYVKPEGPLGFFAESYWALNPTPLFTPRSHMGYAFFDGHIYLAGGLTDQGVQSNIEHARVHPDGFVGSWYRTSEVLSSARKSIGTTVQTSYDSSSNKNYNHLVVAGGENSIGIPSKSVDYFSILQPGVIGTLTLAPSLPAGLIAPLMASNEDALIILGGFDADSQAVKNSYLLPSISLTWEQGKTFLSPFEGPGFAQATGRLFGISGYNTINGRPFIASSDGIFDNQIAPDIPNIFPGSGVVKLNSKILYRLEPSTSLEYCIDDSGDWQPVPDPSSPNPLQISSSGKYSFKSTSGTTSTVVHRDYIVWSTVGYPHISGRLTIQDNYASVQKVYLGSEAFVEPEAGEGWVSMWLEVVVPMDGSYQVIISDNLTDSISYTGTANCSVRENDLISYVFNSSGFPVIDCSSTDGPINLVLQKGTYYLLIEDKNGQAGTSLGIAVVRQ